MKITFLVLTCFLFSFSCSKENTDKSLTIKDDLTIKTVYGRWKLLSKDNLVTNKSIYKTPDQIESFCNTRRICDIILTFSGSAANDTITGHTITNEIFGSFSFNPAVRTFKTIEFGGTKVGEPKWADHVWDNMYRIEAFAVNQKYLRLFFNSKTESLTFQKQ